MTSGTTPAPVDPVGEQLPGPVQRGVLINRARSLLIGGMIGLHLLSVPAVVIGALVGGSTVAISIALGAMLALMFYVIGQAVQIRVAGSPTRTVFAASMMSFGIRAALFGLVIIGWVNLPAESQDRLSAVGLCVGVLVGVVGWLAGMVRAYAKLRVPHYDEPEPEDASDAEASK